MNTGRQGRQGRHGRNAAGSAGMAAGSDGARGPGRRDSGRPPAPRHVEVPPLTVRVAAAPDPFTLRAAITARLAGRALPAGPEAEIADAVARAVSIHAGEAGRCR